MGYFTFPTARDQPPTLWQGMPAPLSKINIQILRDKTCPVTESESFKKNLQIVVKARFALQNTKKRNKFRGTYTDCFYGQLFKFNRAEFLKN